MKKVLLKIFKSLLNVIYWPFKLLKVQHKITFLSRQTNHLSLDFKMIAEEIARRDSSLKLVFMCKKSNNLFRELISYSIFSFKCLYHIATSKICIVDSYTIVSMLKNKQSLKVVQLWHALGAIKKFGYQTAGANSGHDVSTAAALNMHGNYDVIISGSKASTKFFMQAFNYPANKFLNIGLPRIDYLIHHQKKLAQKIFKEYPKLNDKKIILYAPTFRTYGSDNTKELINNTDLKKYNLIIKSHDLQELNIKSHSVFTCDKFTALELLSICDYLITDYSAIAIEAAAIDIKTYYYVYDYLEYEKRNGLNINLFEEMPECVFEDIKDLYKQLNKPYNKKALMNYKNKYLDNQKGNSTELIVNQIFNWLEVK